MSLDERAATEAARLGEFGQAHVLRWLPELPDNEKVPFNPRLRVRAHATQTRLLDQTEALDLAELQRIHAAATAPGAGSFDQVALSPLPKDSCGSEADEGTAELTEAGLKLVAANSVGVILLAGGQGTRLGVTYPKGQFDIGLPSGASLFQLQAERILRLEELGAARTEGGRRPTIPWFIMTSAATRAATEAFFKTNAFFGLKEDQVAFFDQGELPCFSNEGKLMLSSKSTLAMAPDGNGGLYEGLEKSGLLSHLEASGVEHIHVYCVDNCLVRVADPAFLAFAVKLGADCAAKVVEKKDPHEAVGVVCQLARPDGGKEVRVVEYSEISAAQAEALDGDGRLSFRAGNIANHYFRRDFLGRLVGEHRRALLHHVAKKKIPTLDEAGEKVTPSAPNGLKLELFIFDVFAFSSRFGAWAVARGAEFAPLKNASGPDSAETSKAAVLALHKGWLEALGATVEGDVEVSPLLSYAGEGLEAFRGAALKGPILLKPQ